MNRILIITFLIVPILLSACSKKNNEAKAVSDKKELRQEKIRFNIETTTIKGEKFDDYFEVIGNIQPFNSTTLSSETSGKILKLNVNEGDYVNEGDLILEAENDTIKYQIKQLEANLKQTIAIHNQAKNTIGLQKYLLDGEVKVRQLSLNNINKDVKRDEELYNSSVITKEKLDDRKFNRNITEIQYELARINKEQQNIVLATNIETTKAQIEALQAQLELLKIQLSKTYIKSPVSGIIDKLNVDKGELLNPGTPIAEIIRIDKVKLVGGIPEKEISNVKYNDKVKIKVSAYPEKEFYGNIQHIASNADKTSKTFDVKIIIDNKNNLLKPGMLARFLMLRKKYNDAILIPSSAVIQTENSLIVYVEKNEKVTERKVKLGNYFGNKVLVLEGLSEGEKLVTTGQQNLSNGDLVKVVKAN
ncbi:MAG: RND transporter [Candidatus Sericytochromatia bacterium]|nr:MAG: RND transporter [Candidatus Sericytochromatia bacterium]